MQCKYWIKHAKKRKELNAKKINIKNITGEKLDLSQFNGKKILIVNVASECGYTPQYAQLEELYETYHEKLVILGCPSNDFGGQEPGTEKEIVKFW